jgi:hypothetical protein
MVNWSFIGAVAIWIELLSAMSWWAWKVGAVDLWVEQTEKSFSLRADE